MPRVITIQHFLLPFPKHAFCRARVCITSFLSFPFALLPLPPLLSSLLTHMSSSFVSLPFSTDIYLYFSRTSLGKFDFLTSSKLPASTSLEKVAALRSTSTLPLPLPTALFFTAEAIRASAVFCAPSLQFPTSLSFGAIDELRTGISFV